MVVDGPNGTADAGASDPNGCDEGAFVREVSPAYSQASSKAGRTSSKRSSSSRLSLQSWSFVVKEVVRTVTSTDVQDESATYPASIILVAIFVAVVCGMSSFILHMAVGFTGCLVGVNGCSQQIALDFLEPYGIHKSLFFVVLSTLSGLCCSMLIHLPFKGGVAKSCKGGGVVGTKIIISAGQSVSVWVPVLRIVLASIYMGGGNTLGTEGPIVHGAAALGTWLVHQAGFRRRKLFSIFAVIGAAAGISAGFKVFLTGFIFCIEELTRSLSQRTALIITLAAAVATLVEENLTDLLEKWIHLEHAQLVPAPHYWEELSDADLWWLLLLCLPIGVFNGVAGWAYARCAWEVQRRLSEPDGLMKRVPEMFHLAIIGFISGCLGVLAYEATGVNGVWGTTIGVVPEVISKNLSWSKVLLLICTKFAAVILASGGGGPGGTFVPALVSGGLVGTAVGRACGVSEPAVAASSIIGMGSLFASMIHMPVTGIIVIVELTWAHRLMIHIVLANFISCSVCSRLPHGEHSFVHQSLTHNALWLKLGGHDFIETDDQENNVFKKVGVGRLHSMQTSALKWWFMTDAEKLRMIFIVWRDISRTTGASGRQELAILNSHRRRLLQHRLASHDADVIRLAWTLWVGEYISALKRGGVCKDLSNVAWC